uniref:Homeodomain mating-type protein n=1 Tax=Coprinellus disseminatus TaxID=71703 RepID=Q1WMN5_COPDI|nr:homeodomain mating-type protein [Coprinellus disseminatus]
MRPLAPAPSLDAESDAFAISALKCLEAQFFAALEDDEGHLLSQFHSSWAHFQSQLENLHPRLTPAAVEDITRFAVLMATISHSLVETTSTDALDQFGDLLQGEVVAPPIGDNRIPPTSSSPSYIVPSLHWLRANLHNPYPPRAARSAIAKKSKSPMKDVDAWFLDVRKRIGWSQMRHSRFGNRKADIVDAATRFFTGSDPHRPLESVVESEFASIAATVDELYFEKCAGSALASHLDEAVKDLTPHLQASLSKSRRTTRSHPYPTPERSPVLKAKTLSTPEPSSLESPPAKASIQRKKRSRSPYTDSPTDNEKEQVRPTKRSRFVAQSLCLGDFSPFKSQTFDPASPHSWRYPPLEKSRLPSLVKGPHQTPNASTLLPLPGLRVCPPHRLCYRSLRTIFWLRLRTAHPPTRQRFPRPLPATLLGPPTPSSLRLCTVTPPLVSAGSSLRLIPRSQFVQAIFPYHFLSSSILLTIPCPPMFWSISTPIHVVVVLIVLTCDSVDTSITGYDMNFDNFGAGMYGGAMNSFGDSLWSGTPQLHSLASTSQSGSSASTLTSQLNVSPPSSTGVYDVASPSSPSPAKLPSALLTDKARELMELEARCAALRSELAGAS